MANGVYTSLLDKSCESTANCEGKYLILQIVTIDKTRIQKVKCNVCGKLVDRFKPS